MGTLKHNMYIWMYGTLTRTDHMKPGGRSFTGQILEFFSIICQIWILRWSTNYRCPPWSRNQQRLVATYLAVLIWFTPVKLSLISVDHVALINKGGYLCSISSKRYECIVMTYFVGLLFSSVNLFTDSAQVHLFREHYVALSSKVMVQICFMWINQKH